MRIEKHIEEISRLDADLATKSRLLCSRMVRQCKCADCLHKLECDSLNKPVSEKAESIVLSGRDEALSSASSTWVASITALSFTERRLLLVLSAASEILFKNS